MQPIITNQTNQINQWESFDRGNLGDIWIKKESSKYNYIKTNLINRTFPRLRKEEQELLLTLVIRIVNFIYIKFGLGEDFWHQLTQNNLLDSRAILLMALPFINDNPTDDKKHQLENLADLYLKRDAKNEYVYTTSQYNRCIRVPVGADIATVETIERPYTSEYLLDHLELLMMSIETAANKLYVNWADVIPIPMNTYKETKLYVNTVSKINLKQIQLINNYIDPSPSLSYQDIFNVITNHLYHEIKNHKWIIYDVVINGKPITYIDFIEKYIDITPIWENLMWSQLTPNQLNKFTNQWIIFRDSLDPNSNVIYYKIYIFFAKYHVNANRLIKQGKLIVPQKLISEDEDVDEDRVSVTNENLLEARIGLEKVPIDEIYLFFYQQLSSFKKSWYYYQLKIKKQTYLSEGQTNQIPLFVTPKNIYNYCKSMSHFTRILPNSNEIYTTMPRHWITLEPKLIRLILIRLLDIPSEIENNWTNPRKPNWFNINRYLSAFYPRLTYGDTNTVSAALSKANYDLHLLIKSNLIDVIFESLIYHGILSEFRPTKEISDKSIIISASNSLDENVMTKYKQSTLKKLRFTNPSLDLYLNHSYYYATGETYGELEPISRGDQQPHRKSYFDLFSSKIDWPFMYAMNWVSQINFYHHYANNRVIYVTGSTGVGKSTQIPKLLLYSQKMIDYNPSGKIICTQPRVPPTEGNAEWISTEMGIPIKSYSTTYLKDVPTNNYLVQYKHKTANHVSRLASCFLRIVTDGTLVPDLIRAPFLTRSQPDQLALDADFQRAEWVKKYTSKNVYDIVIVDEAHEHNPNMDMILTLVRDAAYVNNSLKLVIISATMDDDEPIYRRYYRLINDNRAYPLSSFISNKQFDRANMDRRIHISPPGETSRYTVTDHFASKIESDSVNESNYVEKGIELALRVINSTSAGDVLLFMAGEADIREAVEQIDSNTTSNIVSWGFFSKMTDEMKEMVKNASATLSNYTRQKGDFFLETNQVTNRVPAGTYNRVVIIATTIAEASISIASLKYVVDTGYAKTSIYNPLEEIPIEKIILISRSSSEQRRGRVGRRSPGDVYYLYEKDKVYSNKIPYRIADTNFEDIYINYLKSNQLDSNIITRLNDINNINLSLKINDLKKNPKDSFRILSILLKNPYPYVDIIKNRYMFVPDETDISQYYAYYGKMNLSIQGDLKLAINLKTYLINNYDDYPYQSKWYKSEGFTSRCHTGYDTLQLRDQQLKFYIIHPEENIIVRNMLTGLLKNIKYNPIIPDSYYYYLLKINDVPVNSVFDPNYIKKINLREIIFPKYYLAVISTSMKLLTIKIDGTPDLQINYRNQSNISAIDYAKYFEDIESQTYYSIIKTNLLSKLGDIKSIYSLDIFDDTNSLMWYALSLPYEISDDIIALIILANIGLDLTKWINVKNRNNVQQYLLANSTPNGDIDFLWKVWSSIKSILVRNQLLAGVEIDATIESQYIEDRNRYLAKSGDITFEKYIILDQMFKSGKMNVTDELYNYVELYNKKFDSVAKTIQPYLNIIADRYKLNSEVLTNFITKWAEIQFTINKKNWLYQYEIKHNLVEDRENQENVLEWAQQRLMFPGIVKNTIWDRILETYIRTYSVNLIKKKSNYYVRVNTGTCMDPDIWSKKIAMEKTFLNKESGYLIYHTYNVATNSIIYLTPVDPKIVFELSPIIYFYLMFDPDHPIRNVYEDVCVKTILDFIGQMAPKFNFKALIAYLDQIDDRRLSKIISDQIIRNKN